MIEDYQKTIDDLKEIIKSKDEIIDMYKKIILDKQTANATSNAANIHNNMRNNLNQRNQTTNTPYEQFQ